MKKYASKVVELAKSCIGIKEGTDKHKKIIDDYNAYKPRARGYKMKYTDSWCSCFVSYISIKLGYTDIIPTEVGCGKHIELFKKLGVWVENDAYIPKAGDIIFYDWEDDGKGDNKGGANHVGYVINNPAANGTIEVVEGNYSNAVKVRKLKVNGKYIRGYAIPKYDEEKVDTIPTETSETKYVYNCDLLNVRKGAGTKYSIVRTIKKGTEVNVYEISGSWARIGANEWVSNKYLTKTKPASYKTKMVSNCSVLNVRNGAGTKYKVVRTIKKGTKVTIYKTSGTWSKISSSKEEWCSSKYLK